MFHLVLYVELVLRLKSDYVWYFYYALFVPNMPHLIITYISISHFYRGLIVHVVKMLVSCLRLLDNYTSRSGWGLGSELLYYVVHFLAITVCSCLYLVIVLMPFKSIHTVRYFRILHSCLYVICGLVSFSSPMVIMTLTVLR